MILFLLTAYVMFSMIGTVLFLALFPVWLILHGYIDGLFIAIVLYPFLYALWGKL